MNKSKIKTPQAGTAADSSIKANVTTSSQTIGNPYVGSSFVVPPDYDDGFDDIDNSDDDGCEYCGNIYCAGSCQDEDF